LTAVIQAEFDDFGTTINNKRNILSFSDVFWYDERGQIDENSPQHQLFARSPFEHSLRVHDVGISDAGKYMAVVVSDDQVVRATSRVIVYGN
jgi:hypothetical protein